WHPKQNQIVKMVIIVFTVAGLILIPITRYASIPYLHPTSQELEATMFVHQYYNGRQPIYYTEYPPYTRVLAGKDPGWEISGFYEDMNFTKHHYLVVERYVTRDGYYIYAVSRRELVNYLVSSLSKSHNLVYTSGNFTKLFLLGA
ncbi:MAG: hypothetical protein QXW36_05655, partial [Desulfurococcaceae archaeon]